MEFLKLFQNHSQYEEFAGGGGMLRPNVSHCIGENEVHYNPFSWTKEYLTFVALEDGEFGFTPRNGYAINYSIDNGKTWEAPASATHQTVPAGSKVMWKSADITNTTNSTNGGLLKMHKGGIGTFTSTGHFEVQGNIMSLISGDSFANADELINGEGFDYLFQDCTGLTSAENLILPATTMVDGYYSNMFAGCTSLATAPELPATTLAAGCYANMFNGCTSLATAPELPATTLAQSCYSEMFYGCTSLTTAPELPATTLADSCYYYMFSNCTSLTVAPELPATTLAEYCYNSIFRGCTSLNSITCLATDISATGCTSNWVSDVAANGTFTKAASMSSWTTGVDGIPTGWTVQDV